MARTPLYNLNSITVKGMIKRGQIPDPSIPGNEDLFYYGSSPTICECDKDGNDIPGTTRRLEDDIQMDLNTINQQQQMFTDASGRNIFTEQGTGLRYPAPQFPVQGSFGYNPQQQYVPNMGYQQPMYNPNMNIMQGYGGYPQQQQMMYNPNMNMMPMYGGYPQQQMIMPQGFGYPTNMPMGGNISFDFNPFMAGSQYSVFETQMKERRREESEIWKLCAQASTHYAGLNVSDEEIDKIFDPDREVKAYQKMVELIERDFPKPYKVVLMCGDEEYVNSEYTEKVELEKSTNNGVSATEQKEKMRKEHPEMYGINIRGMYSNIQNLLARAIPGNMNIAIANARHNYIYDKQKEKYPDSMDLFEFLGHTHEMWIDMLEREQMATYGGKLNFLYDSEEFRRRLIDPRRTLLDPNAPCRYPTDPSSAFSLGFLAENGRGFATNKEYSDYTGISYNPDLGCMEVTVPERIRKTHTTYDEARQNFMSSIINQRR